MRALKIKYHSAIQVIGHCSYKSCQPFLLNILRTMQCRLLQYRGAGYFLPIIDRPDVMVFIAFQHKIIGAISTVVGGLTRTIVGHFHVRVPGGKHPYRGIKIRALENKMFSLPEEFRKRFRWPCRSFSQADQFFQLRFAVICSHQQPFNFQCTTGLKIVLAGDVPVLHTDILINPINQLLGDAIDIIIHQLVDLFF